MIAAFDVHYFEDGSASAAAVLFNDFRDAETVTEYFRFIREAADYVPGEFYKRELPCILALIEQFNETPDEMIIDGYVKLGDQSGLGQHLFNTFKGKIPVIGVAKSKFKNARGIEVFRGRSKRPLYVTSAGIDPYEASERIKSMHGDYRVPTLLKRVDLLAKNERRYQK